MHRCMQNPQAKGLLKFATFLDLLTFYHFYCRRRRWGRSTRSRGGLGIGIGINSTTKTSIFRNTKKTILMRKSPQRIRNHRTQHQSLLEHVREKFDFVWNSATFRLDDDSDSVNFGDLVVSPPPSGSLHMEVTNTK